MHDANLIFPYSFKLKSWKSQFERAIQFGWAPSRAFFTHFEMKLTVIYIATHEMLAKPLSCGLDRIRWFCSSPIMNCTGRTWAKEHYSLDWYSILVLQVLTSKRESSMRRERVVNERLRFLDLSEDYSTTFRWNTNEPDAATPIDDFDLIFVKFNEIFIKLIMNFISV